MTCICDNCDKQFTLTSDRDDVLDGDDRSTHLRISECESGGVYDVNVRCPWCRHVHDLY